MPFRRSILLTALVAALALAMLPAASASAKTFKTGVVVSLKVPAFNGKRHLQARQLPQRPQGQALPLLQRVDDAAGSGQNERQRQVGDPGPRPLSSGAYFAKVSKRGNCTAGKSQILTID